MSGHGSGPVGVGVIGAGVISGQYLKNLIQFPDLEVLFVADLDLNVARAQAETFGIAASGSVQQLLARPDIELVVNLTVPAAHVDVGLSIVRAGKHVWTEKPFALDRRSGRQLLDEARDRNLRAAAAPDTFLGTGLQAALRAAEAGAIGRPLNALALFQSPGPELWHPNPPFLYDAGAGPLFDMGPYYLTLLVQVFGPVKRVSATASTARASRVIASGPLAGNRFPVNVPTHHSALIEFETGAAAQAIFSFESHLRRSGVLEIVGTEGSLALPDPNGFGGRSELWTTGSDQPEVIEPTGSPFSRGIGVVELARAIRGGIPERASGVLAYHVLDIMVSITEAARLGEPVDVVSTMAAAPTLPADWDPAAATLGTGLDD